MLRGSLRRTPRLLAVVAVAAGTFAATGVHASTTVGGCTPQASWPAAKPALAAQVVALINAHRQSVGLSALAVSPALTASATWKARHMAQYQYMGHDDPAPPVARAWYERIAACGFEGAAGENLAAGFRTPAAAVQAWLSDPPHKANLEGPWNLTGVGVAEAPNGMIFWAQDFGKGSIAAGDRTTAAQRCVVPNVFHLPLAHAVAKVQAAGCAVRRISVRVAGSEVQVGAVAWQAPRMHVTMPRGAVVTIAVRVAR
ncbi:MAG TPA: CAP domain-containing protein [Gaiellaceae bacterium]|nr:CAP domain-containing protein [Gaiellaceae bacterium]